MQIFKIH